MTSKNLKSTVAAFAIAVLTLTACAGETETVESSAPAQPVVSESVSESANSTDSEQEPTTEVSGSCAGIDGIESPSSEEEDRVGGYVQLEMRDTGTNNYANGETAFDEHGDPAWYIVAEGDTMQGIADRFCTEAWYLEMLNSIRRNATFVGTGYTVLYPGDTINLNRFTIATVGDENGSVYDYSPDFHIPPQD